MTIPDVNGREYVVKQTAQLRSQEAKRGRRRHCLIIPFKGMLPIT
jgi:hypothetical protein